MTDQDTSKMKLACIRVVRLLGKWHLVSRFVDDYGQDHIVSRRIPLYRNADRLDVMRFVTPMLPEECRGYRGWVQHDDRHNYSWIPSKDIQYR